MMYLLLKSDKYIDIDDIIYIGEVEKISLKERLVTFFKRSNNKYRFKITWAHQMTEVLYYNNYEDAVHDHYSLVREIDAQIQLQQALSDNNGMIYS